jgi:hypothetical protein
MYVQYKYSLDQNLSLSLSSLLLLEEREEEGVL